MWYVWISYINMSNIIDKERQESIYEKSEKKKLINKEMHWQHDDNLIIYASLLVLVLLVVL